MPKGLFRDGRKGAAATALAGICALILTGCQRENRNLSASLESPPQPPLLSDLRPGSSSPPPDDPRDKTYDGNATHIANGQRYFQAFNCNGCHFNGGGGIGPALMDDKWRYGGKTEQIVASILQGRPNGMPAFKDKIPDQQAWEIAAYIRTLSGNADKLAASSRVEGMRSIPPINNIDRQPPKSDPDPSTVGPQ